MDNDRDTWNESEKAFFSAFREQALRNPKIRFDGKFYKGKRLIADICRTNRSRTNVFGLRLYLPKKNIGDKLNRLPLHIIEYIKKHKCSDCDSFAGLKARNGGVCVYRVDWSRGGEDLRCCPYHCFDFIDLYIIGQAVFDVVDRRRQSFDPVHAMFSLFQ